MTHRGIHIDGRPTFTPTPGPAPMLQWIALDRLVIDEAYQRPLGPANWRLIEKIAAHFQWSRFAPVLVAPTHGGLFALIDGQHRSHAAALCGLAEVPAMVVDATTEEQSRAFAWVNGQTVRVNQFQIFKAALTAREDWAVRADQAVSAAGCRLMSYNESGKNKMAGQLYCINLVRKLIEAGHDPYLTAALAAVRAVPTVDKTPAYSDFFLRPWIGAGIEAKCLDVDALARVLSRRNPFKTIEAAVIIGPRVAFRQMIEAEMTV